MYSLNLCTEVCIIFDSFMGGEEFQLNMIKNIFKDKISDKITFRLYEEPL